MPGFQSATGGGQNPAPRNVKPLNQTPPPGEQQRRWWQFGLTTWLLIFGLIVINAGIFVKPEMLDKVFAQLWRLLGFVDVRFWPWWYWPVFWIIVIGLVGRYLLAERIEFTEVQGEDADQLRKLRRLITIIAVGLSGVMICVHSNLAGHLQNLIAWFYSSNFTWWVLPLAVSLIILLLGVVWMVQRYQGNNDAESWKPRTIIKLIAGGIAGTAVIVVGVIAYANGFFSLPSFSLPWWASPLAIMLMIALLGIVWMVQRAREEKDAKGWESRTIIKLIAGGIAGTAVIVVGVIAYANGFFSLPSFSLPWWAPPLAIMLMIALLGIVWMVQRAREENDAKGGEPRTLIRLVVGGIAGVTAIVVGTITYTNGFLSSLSMSLRWWTLPLAIMLVIVLLGIVWMVQRAREEGRSESWNLRTVLGMVSGGIAVITAIVVGIVAYNNGFFSSMSLSLPWWGWPAFWVVVIAGLLAYRIFTVFRGKDTTAPTKRVAARITATVQTPAAPIQQAAPAPAKPKGFNAATGNRPQAGFRAGQPKERTPLLERLGLSKFSEMGMVVWLVPVGLVLLAVAGYFCYRLMTMEWIDAEGYPISKPWWVWVLPFVLLTLGVVT
ncbi:MAG: hypothetical protein FWC50_08345 [Planctomycetaceae bacterium]|nr:hypothetical protein [Planctomycetaceae bacterium]